MQQNYTAVVKQDGPWWIGWIEEIPGVNCQEASREELLVTLRETLAEALELNREEARSAAGLEFEEFPIAVSSAAILCLTSRRMVVDCCAWEPSIPGGSIPHATRVQRFPDT